MNMKPSYVVHSLSVVSISRLPHSSLNSQQVFHVTKIFSAHSTSNKGALHQHILIRQHTIMATAQEQALGLAELLETILLQLPPRNLLFAQKVCKDWKQAMEASPSIQKALFFIPGTKHDVHPACNTALEHILARETFATNPFLMSHGYFNERPPYKSHRLRYDLLPIREEASCLRMFLTQPPTDTSTMFRIKDRRNMPSIYVQTLRIDRFGILVKGFQDGKQDMRLEHCEWYGAQVFLLKRKRSKASGDGVAK
ncbi:hypothetical protein LTR56_014133 [Elasticomyces elasticus]|nr:hypothetical protein LTR56_014133 [Elasticomyces elasticus]KAK3662740.1 hypothetical protein LTR22_006356 [Elasticomyces elasticus]KAK4918036.1 hypothetical protein LTR49_014174 [Elasticomyces elasticus]KAK5754467.1 hypothetical protein LTS12_015422 [Elasticomyces elasticus]